MTTREDGSGASKQQGPVSVVQGILAATDEATLHESHSKPCPPCSQNSLWAGPGMESRMPRVGHQLLVPHQQLRQYPTVSQSGQQATSFSSKGLRSH